MIKRILVPTDFSQASLAAIDHAVDLAERYAAKLFLLHVVEPVPYALPAAEMMAEQRKFAHDELARLAGKLGTLQVPCETIVRSGTPYAEIVESALGNAADLIVMATHGRTGFSHLLMGSVAEKVVRTSACPVLTVRSATARPAGATAQARAAG